MGTLDFLLLLLHFLLLALLLGEQHEAAPSELPDHPGLDAVLGGLVGLEGGRGPGEPLQADVALLLVLLPRVLRQGARVVEILRTLGAIHQVNPSHVTLECTARDELHATLGATLLSVLALDVAGQVGKALVAVVAAVARGHVHGQAATVLAHLATEGAGHLVGDLGLPGGGHGGRGDPGGLAALLGHQVLDVGLEGGEGGGALLAVHGGRGGAGHVGASGYAGILAMGAGGPFLYPFLGNGRGGVWRWGQGVVRHLESLG